jgi:hypothetical protein
MPIATPNRVLEAVLNTRDVFMESEKLLVDVQKGNCKSRESLGMVHRKLTGPTSLDAAVPAPVCAVLDSQQSICSSSILYCCQQGGCRS